VVSTTSQNLTFCVLSRLATSGSRLLPATSIAALAAQRKSCRCQARSKQFEVIVSEQTASEFHSFSWLRISMWQTVPPSFHFIHIATYLLASRRAHLWGVATPKHFLTVGLARF